MFVIFAALAVTSNNWSIKKLKKNWKRLHSLTYAAAFILPWHIFAKMEGHWSILTAVSIVIALDVLRLWLFRQYQNKSKNDQAKLWAESVLHKLAGRAKLWAGHTLYRTSVKQPVSNSRKRN